MSSIGYEIDFAPVGEGEKSGDAIALRYGSEGDYKIHVVDGGTISSGEDLVAHIKKYYGNPAIIDNVVCTHPDGDHASGLRQILEEFSIGTLWMNRPWLYVDELIERFKDQRITPESLSNRLKEAYPYVDLLETLANEKGIEIKETFQGSQIGDFKVLSPSYEFYIDQIAESAKTPDVIDESIVGRAVSAVRKAAHHAINWINESWNEDYLPENVSTSPENESSIIQWANFDGRRVLLTADAGVKALAEAADFLESTEGMIEPLRFIQIPHHGSRHNVSKSVLNRWIGGIVEEGEIINTISIVSCAKESEKHPRKSVTNAFRRRGVKVTPTNGKTVRTHNNMPAREGWKTSEFLPFYEKVEAYSDGAAV